MHPYCFVEYTYSSSLLTRSEFYRDMVEFYKSFMHNFLHKMAYLRRNGIITVRRNIEKYTKHLKHKFLIILHEKINLKKKKY